MKRFIVVVSENVSTIDFKHKYQTSMSTGMPARAGCLCVCAHSHAQAKFSNSSIKNVGVGECEKDYEHFLKLGL